MVMFVQFDIIHDSVQGITADNPSVQRLTYSGIRDPSDNVQSEVETLFQRVTANPVSFVSSILTLAVYDDAAHFVMLNACNG